MTAYFPFGPISGQVVLDSTGGGALRFAPAGEEWDVQNLSVRASSAVKEATADVYIGQVGSIYRHSGTYAGSSGDNNTLETPIHLQDGSPIFVVWTGGDVGATATATVSGQKSVPGRGFRA